MTSELSYYHNNEKLEGKIPFPITHVGEVSELILECVNELDVPMSLRPFSNDPDLVVAEYPPRLLGHSKGLVLLRFSPKENRVNPLFTDCGFELVIG